MSESELREVRLQKAEALREAGQNPYPERFERTHTSVEADALPDDTSGIRVCGRIKRVNAFGRLIFVGLQDFYGEFQLSLEQKTLGKPAFKQFGKLFDVGDFLGAEGTTWTTRKGTKTLRVSEYHMLSKALLPLPEKWHGIQDQEARYRQRYLDLIMNPETRERFRVRNQVIRTIRRFLDEHRFEEVETPVLQTKPSGALAKPFVSHHNALDLEVYLTIAPETWLKRLVVGGFDRVYEFARCFRNEGMDPSHLQEFTMLEYYAAYWNYVDNMRFTEQLIKHVLGEVKGGLRLSYGGRELDFSGEWPVKTFRELILEDAGLDIDAHESVESLKAAIAGEGIELDGIETVGRGTLIDVLYKKVSRPRLVNPTFLTSHPIDLSPLARRNDANPRVTDRFQLVVNSWEIVNAYSELVDPVDQRERFESQAAARAQGDEEAMPLDEEYLTAMEHGMPPMSGWGMGIDRFVALLTDSDNLREVVFFPLMKPRLPGEAEAAPAPGEGAEAAG